MPSATTKDGVSGPRQRISRTEVGDLPHSPAGWRFLASLGSAPGPSGRENGVGHDRPRRAVGIDRRPHRIGTRVHTNRLRTAITQRNRGRILVTAPRPRVVVHHLRIGGAVRKSESSARRGESEAGGAAGTAGAVDRLGRGDCRYPRRHERQNDCFHRHAPNKAQYPARASGSLIRRSRRALRLSFFLHGER